MNIEEQKEKIIKQCENYCSNMSCNDCQLDFIIGKCYDGLPIFEDELCVIVYLINQLATERKKNRKLSELLKKK